MRLLSAVLALALALALGACKTAGQETVENGEPCRFSAQCVSGLCMSDLDGGEPTVWKEGTCASLCPEQSCEGAGEVCVDITVGGLCLPGCSTDAPCREGYVCHPILAACLPDCRTEPTWCGAGRSCDAGGVCQVNAPALAPLGAACLASRDCASGLCFAAEEDEGGQTGWKDGTCARPCPEGPCEAGFGCTLLGEQRFCLPACTADADCREGYLCSDSLDVCLPDCREGFDCGEGYVCDEGRCAVPEHEGAALGEPCAAPLDCASGVCLAEVQDGEPSGWTGGTCAVPCDKSACPEASTCVPLDGEAWCLTSCDAETACREGYVCYEETGACLPECGAGFHCGDGFRCAGDGRCDPPATGSAGVGAGCDAPYACASGACLAEAKGWAGGTCATPCTDEGCPDGASCVGLDGERWCVASCAEGASCREGYVCDEDTSACLPDCRNAEAEWCGEGAECGSDDGLCKVVVQELAPFGAQCDADTSCASGVCFEVEDGWHGGTCVRPCDGDACPEGATCVGLDGKRWCVSACAAEEPRCRPDYFCREESEACLPDCRKNAEDWCGAGSECNTESGLCELEVQELAELGAACGADSGCASGVCFGAADGWPEGTCAAPCTDQCGTDGGTCMALGGEGWCVGSCTGPGTCRAGYVCYVESGACLPSCREGFDCGEGFRCTTNGQCEAAPAAGAAVGEVCDASSDCASGICFAATEGWPEGTCTAVCGAGGCSDGVCVSLDGERWCVGSCTTQADCRTGYRCYDEIDACLPSCTPQAADWCGEAMRCNTNTGRCEPDPGPQNELGGTCSQDYECTTGHCLPEQGPQGTCTRPCNDTAPCANGTSCMPMGPQRWCLFSCTARGCPATHVCHPHQQLCMPRCTLPTDCQPPLTCTPQGFCAPGGPGPGGP